MGEWIEVKSLLFTAIKTGVCGEFTVQPSGPSDLIKRLLCFAQQVGPNMLLIHSAKGKKSYSFSRPFVRCSRAPGLHIMASIRPCSRAALPLDILLHDTLLLPDPHFPWSVKAAPWTVAVHRRCVSGPLGMVACPSWSPSTGRPQLSRT
jgi:hypothetical protein